jgi:hypothetical protein
MQAVPTVRLDVVSYALVKLGGFAHWRLTIELSGHTGIGLPRLTAIISEGGQARPAALVAAPMNC